MILKMLLKCIQILYSISLSTVLGCIIHKYHYCGNNYVKIASDFDTVEHTIQLLIRTAAL